MRRSNWRAVAEAMLIVGGKNSSNTTKLYDIGQTDSARARITSKPKTRSDRNGLPACKEWA